MIHPPVGMYMEIAYSGQEIVMLTKNSHFNPTLFHDVAVFGRVGPCQDLDSCRFRRSLQIRSKEVGDRGRCLTTNMRLDQSLRGCTQSTYTSPGPSAALTFSLLLPNRIWSSIATAGWPAYSREAEGWFISYICTGDWDYCLHSAG